MVQLILRTEFPHAFFGEWYLNRELPNKIDEKKILFVVALNIGEITLLTMLYNSVKPRCVVVGGNTCVYYILGCKGHWNHSGTLRFPVPGA